MTEEEIQVLHETNKQLVERVGFLEKDLSKAIIKRDEAKQALADSSQDEELVKELDNYKAKLESIEADKAEIETTYQGKLAQRDMIGQLTSLGIKVHNDDALKTVGNLILSDAKYDADAGAFNFINEDGTTRFNQADKPYSVMDKINELKESDKSYLFVQDTGTGTKPTTSIPTPQPNDIDSIRSQYSY